MIDRLQSQLKNRDEQMKKAKKELNNLRDDRNKLRRDLDDHGEWYEPVVVDKTSQNHVFYTCGELHLTIFYREKHNSNSGRVGNNETICSRKGGNNHAERTVFKNVEFLGIRFGISVQQ